MEQQNKYSKDGSFGKVRAMAHEPSALAQQLYYCVKSGGWHSCNDQYQVERQQGISDCLLLCTVAGEGRLFYEEKEHLLVPGSAALLAPQHAHRYFTPENGVWEFYWLHFCGASSASFAEYIRKKNGGIFVGPVAESCGDHVQRIIELKAQQDLDFETIASELISVMLHQMVAVVPEGLVEQNQAVAKALAYLHENYQRHIDLQALQKAAFVSRAYLVRVFEASTGYTPYEYLLKYRISQAKELLMTGDAPVKEVALQVGFSYPGNFISAFRKLEGMTPAQYRKHYLL